MPAFFAGRHAEADSRVILTVSDHESPVLGGMLRCSAYILQFAGCRVFGADGSSFARVLSPVGSVWLRSIQ